MCAVHRVLMKLQEQQKKDPETEGLPSEGGREERAGTEPTSETQVLSVQGLTLSFKGFYFVLSYKQVLR